MIDCALTTAGSGRASRDADPERSVALLWGGRIYAKGDISNLHLTLLLFLASVCVGQRKESDAPHIYLPACCVRDILDWALSPTTRVSHGSRHDDQERWEAHLPERSYVRQVVGQLRAAAPACNLRRPYLAQRSLSSNLLSRLAAARHARLIWTLEATLYSVGNDYGTKFRVAYRISTSSSA